MSYLELKTYLPVITPKGSGRAIIMIDYGPEANLLWVVIQDDTGEIWTWSNYDIRVKDNITLGRITNE